MQPAAKKVRISEPIDDRAQLKPSQVSQTSNIFGPRASSRESATADEAGGSDEEIEAESDASGSDEDNESDAASLKSEADEEEDNMSGIERSSTKHDRPKKKNDPNDFALAMQKILSAGLTTTNRKIPILARSLESRKLDEAAQDERLEQKVRKQLSAEKKAKLEKGHNSQVLGDTDADVARTIEREREMRKIAQKGVVRLFNAIRAAKLTANDGGTVHTKKDERSGLSVRQGAGVKKRETEAAETSKSNFLDLIKSGGRPSVSLQ